MKKTRFKNLGYKKEAPGMWSFYDLSNEYPASIGAKYATSAELLADLTRFAAERGYNEG